MLISGALYLHGLDDAIAGASDCGKIIYDYKKVVCIFEKQGMSLDEAVEYVDYNVMGVQCNGAGFIMMYDKEMIDIDDISSWLGIKINLNYQHEQISSWSDKHHPLRQGY